MSQYFTNDNNLRSEYRNIVYNYKNYSFNFVSDLGVFSKDKVDYGSRLLVENYIEHGDKFKKVLDVGCGYGFIGVVVAKVMSSHVDMVDVNKRAVHLSNINIDNHKVDAKAFISNCYDDVSDKYDVIISNPPIRAGKDIYMKIINDAFNYLNDDGAFWFVMNRDQGAKSTIKKIENVYKVDVIDKSKGFFVILCKKR